MFIAHHLRGSVKLSKLILKVCYGLLENRDEEEQKQAEETRIHSATRISKEER